MCEIIRLEEHHHRGYTDAYVHVHLQPTRTNKGAESIPMSEFLVFGYESNSEENEILAYKGPENIRVEALKALLTSFNLSNVTEAERKTITSNAESLKKIFNEFLVKVQVW